MTKKVLIIPSWYPLASQALNGSYFQEQARFLSRNDGLVIQVLFGEKKSCSLLRWIWTFIQSWLNTKYPIFDATVQNDPPAFCFKFPANRRVPDNLQIGLELRLFWKTYSRLIQNGWQPDLLHAQSGMDAGIYVHHISKQTGIPFVIMEHQVFVFHYYSKLRSTLIMDAFKAARRTAAVSYDERRQVMMNQPACNPDVIWNLVDEDRYSIDLGKRKKEFTVITILNSLPIKGAVEFLEAIAIVLQTDPSLRFIMIGKGANKSSAHSSENLFVRKSRELGIFEKGEFFPFVPREQISDVLNQAHVFVSPTIQEPHGIAVREAMMCGLPVVSTANGGVEDSITPDTGIIVPVRDAKSMAEAILKVKENYSWYDPQIIRELAIKQCGKDAFLQSMTSFYRP
ncbi:glycosyltransferase [Algoriphagus terrigena]|uniref:glycosyltransferase n=1 Tax=Algoriphagus terrigena TaxID=344884 RepID=UPI00146FBF7B|nr:glycosyltransferase [Algoriphagus terrigena]